MSTSASDVELLGAPIFQAGVAQALSKKSQAYEVIFRRLGCVRSRVANFLLQKSAGVPSLVYLLRASPAFAANDELLHIDEQFAAASESILKISFSGNALIQLSLSTS